MKFFNVPADFKLETIDRYDALNNQYPDSKVSETYGQITINNPFGSGRPSDLIPKVDMDLLSRYAGYSQKKGIQFNYTLNATCLGNKEFTEEGMTEILSFLRRIYEMGIQSITVAIPSLIELIKMTKYPFDIKASVLCEIINANKAMTHKKLGANRAVLYEPINRDFDTLKSIRQAFGPGTEVIVNVICHKNCIYRPFHQNQCSHDNDEMKTSITYYSHRCIMRRVEEASSLLKLAWIRPEDLKYYTGIGIQYFKLQGRHTVYKGDPVKAVECYMKEDYSGNLMELLDLFAPTNSFAVYLDNKKLDGFIRPFYKNQNFCKNDCERCGYCQRFIRERIDYEETMKIFGMAGEFYEQYDQFINTARKILETSPESGAPVRPNVLNDVEDKLEFDFETTQ